MNPELQEIQQLEIRLEGMKHRFNESIIQGVCDRYNADIEVVMSKEKGHDNTHVKRYALYALKRTYPDASNDSLGRMMGMKKGCAGYYIRGN